MRSPSGKRKRENVPSEEEAKAGTSAQMGADKNTNGGPKPLPMPPGNVTKNGNRDWQDVQKESQDALQQCFQDPGLQDSVKQYEKLREGLLKELRPRCWDYTAKTGASEAELKAAEIVQRIREDERVNLFGNVPSEAIPGPTSRDMGGQFLTNLSRIEESKLFDITKQMPKGAHLHAHFNAELNVSDLLSRVRDMDTMFIRATRPLVESEDYMETEMVFTVLPTDHPEADPFSKDYNPDFKTPGSNPWMKWKVFQYKFLTKRPEALGSIDAETWVRGKMVLQEEEVYGVKQTLNGYVSAVKPKRLQKLTFPAFGLDLIKLPGASKVFSITNPATEHMSASPCRTWSGTKSCTPSCGPCSWTRPCRPTTASERSI